MSACLCFPALREQQCVHSSSGRLPTRSYTSAEGPHSHNRFRKTIQNEPVSQSSVCQLVACFSSRLLLFIISSYYPVVPLCLHCFLGCFFDVWPQKVNSSKQISSTRPCLSVRVLVQISALCHNIQ